MASNSQKLGKIGEEIANKHLLKNGYAILETNWRYKKYEVDLIARIGETIVFVEVKTRKSGTFGEPEIFVTRQKQNYLIAAAHQYMFDKNCELEARFDIIAIIITNRNQNLNHLEGAFTPEVKKI